MDLLDIEHRVLDDAAVRIDLEIDDDILTAVERIAAERNTTAGSVLSDLARKALESAARGSVRNGVPLLPRRPGAAARPTMGLVKRLLGES